MVGLKYVAIYKFGHCQIATQKYYVNLYFTSVVKVQIRTVLIFYFQTLLTTLDIMAF